MEYRKFNDTYVVRLERGEEITEQLAKLCEKEGILLAEINGLGAADYVAFGLYSVAEQLFHKTVLEGAEFEISSLHGSVSEKDGKPYLHIHITAAGADGVSHGGHLSAARISATAEIFVQCLEGRVGRRHDDATGLNLFSF